MQLDDIAKLVCEAGGLDFDKFVQFAAEDNHTGYGSPKSHWPGMSISADEGKVLYALVRMLRPINVLEVGVWNGCSSVHMLAALARNKFGFLTSWDIEPSIVPMIPLGLHARWLPEVADALIHHIPVGCDFVFEDGPHTREFTGAFVKRIMMELKNPPMALISHDCLYPGWGHNVLDGWADAGLNPVVLDTGRGMCLHFWSRDET